MSTKKHTEWKELPPDRIDRALAGDRHDLDALVQWYWPVVWSAVAARVRGVAGFAVEMPDLVSGVWLELLRNDRRRLRYYDGSRGELGYFIRLQAGQIAWSLITRRFERPHVAYDASLEPADEGVEPRMLERDFLERLAHRAKAHLGASDWALLNAAFIEGLSSEEIAARTGKKVETIYQQKYRLGPKLEALARALLEEDRPGTQPPTPIAQLLLASLLGPWLAASTTSARTSEPHADAVKIGRGAPLERSTR